MMAAGFYHESAEEQRVSFIGCFIMPMTGVFTSMADGNNGNGGMFIVNGVCVFIVILHQFRHSLLLKRG